MNLTTPADPILHTPTPNRSNEGATRIHDAYLEMSSDIDGWFGKGAVAIWDALLCFQRAQRVRGHMLEIGVWHGKSAALLAMHGDPNTRLHLVDYKLQRSHVERAIAAANPSPDLDVRTIEGDSRSLHIHPVIAECFQAHRWIHIDGEHSARAVTNDLAIANSLLSPEGIVVVDDFFSWMYPQVTEAVFRYVRNCPDDLALFLCGFNKAYLARPHFVHRYLAYCAEHLSNDLAARRIECTVSKTTYPAEMNTFGVGPRFQGLALCGPDWDRDSIRY